MVALDFTGGDYNSSNKDGNNFWLTTGTYTVTQDIAGNSSTIDISDLTLNHASAGMFSSYTLNVYLRAEYKLNGSATTSYKYFFGDSNGASVGQKSMPNTTLSLLTTAQIAAQIIPHNSDGTRPDLVIRGFCDAATNATYVPENTLAYTSAISLSRIPRGPRVKDGGVWKNTILYVKDNGTWKIAVPYVKDNGTWKIGGG